ncbi:MAG: cation:dicarboxylase symporter family transporter [Xenococcaceae cyanobacterium MO_188.B32]|nr:cation:dicarboxylase symporter family transporter [Xenococcaceae cyanobacterium MO_188.B32]
MSQINQYPQQEISNPPTKQRLGLSELTTIGLFLGIGCGLFFGEGCAKFQILGDAFVGLLQMTVLPYIVLSLIGGIGKLDLKHSKQLAGKAILVLLLLWAIAIVTILLIPLAFPKLVSASFFSTSLVEPPKKFDFLGLFIPANPFNSLAENEVPAVVIFCLLVGTSIISINKKKRFIKLVDLLSESMSKVTKMIVKLTPVGVFFITASAAGTMTLAEIGRLQGYLIVYTVATFLLGFGLLPALGAVLTPFRYRDLLQISKDSFILAFATGKVLVVLPMLIEDVKKMFRNYELGGKETESIVEVLVPLGFPFPHLGRLLTTSFIIFTAWYLGTPLKPEQYPLLIGAGFFSHFGSSTISIPFLLDLAHLPSDMFQLFVVTNVLIDRFSNALAATYLFIFTVLTTCALRSLMRFRWRQLGILTVSSAIAGIISLFGIRTYLGYASQDAYDKDKVIASMQLLENLVPATIVEPAPNPAPLRTGETVWGRIKRRGVIRIGFDPDNLPWSYYNSQQQLVGFDIDMAHQLAHELGVKIEFVPLQFSTLGQLMGEDHFDLAMSGIVGTIERFQQTRFSDPYLYVNLALVVPDYRDEEFATLESINQMKNLRIGVEDPAILTKKIQELLPDVEFIDLASDREFFEGQGAGRDLDALFESAEAGSAWTLLYPNFQVVTPFPRNLDIPLVYPFLGKDDLLGEVVDHWIEVKKHDGTIQDAYDYWILGKGGEQKQPRWSIIRNVLHWID